LILYLGGGDAQVF
jgi:hypothetical protein